MSNPYAPPPLEQDLLQRPALSAAEASILLRMPALGLVVAGSVGLIAAVALAIGGILIPPEAERALINPRVDLFMILGAQGCVAFLQVVMILGGRAMMRIQNYRLARWAAVVAIASLGGMCLLSLPFAIWALLLLHDHRIRDAFESQQAL
jgi:hypothetical protein